MTNFKDIIPEEYDITQKVGDTLLDYQFNKKNMNIFQVALQWIWRSSKNPENISLFVKGALGFLVMLGVKGIEDTEGFSNSIVTTIIVLGQLTTAIFAVWGFVRKIYLTYKG